MAKATAAALLVLLAPAFAAGGGAARPPLLGARQARPGLGAGARARPASAAAASSSAAPTPPAAKPSVAAVWNVSAEASWTTGVAFLDDGATNFVASFGDWYTAPFHFAVGTAPLAGFNGTFSSSSPSVPGAVFATGGLRGAAAFSGQDFATYEGVFAAYDASGVGPVWLERVAGVEGEFWQVGAPIRASLDGSVLAFSRTALDHYDPLGPKHAEVAAVDAAAFPPRALLVDASFANGTGLEELLLSDDGSVLVAVVAQESPAGRINTSEVRVYDVAGGQRLSAFVTGYVFASCLSADGRWLVLATCDSENAIEVYAIDASQGLVSQTLNSSYPSLPGTFTFAAACAVSNAGSAFVAFPLWWGGAINSSAVAFYAALPREPTAPGTFLAPTSLWQSPGISTGLQDDIISSVFLEGCGVFAYTSWGGAPTTPGGDIPPTLHVFSVASPAAPLLELATPSLDAACGAAGSACSGSLEALDAALDPATGDLLLLAAGLRNHANEGSTGGVVYLWRVSGLPGAFAARPGTR